MGLAVMRLRCAGAVIAMCLACLAMCAPNAIASSGVTYSGTISYTRSFTSSLPGYCAGVSDGARQTGSATVSEDWRLTFSNATVPAGGYGEVPAQLTGSMHEHVACPVDISGYASVSDLDVSQPATVGLLMKSVSPGQLTFSEIVTTGYDAGLSGTDTREWSGADHGSTTDPVSISPIISDTDHELTVPTTGVTGEPFAFAWSWSEGVDLTHELGTVSVSLSTTSPASDTDTPPPPPPDPPTEPLNDLSLSLAPPGSVGTLGLTRYRLTIDNRSSREAANVVVRAHLPKHVVPASRPRIGKSLCTTGRRFVCRLGTFPQGGHKTVAFSLRAEGSVNGFSALTKMTISSSTPDADLSDNVTRVRQQIPASRPTAGGRARQTDVAAKAVEAAAFSALSWHAYCGKAGSGTQGEGTAGAVLSLGEFGKSGTTHFTLEWQLQEQNMNGGWNWAGSWSPPTSQFPNDSDSYHWTLNHFFDLSDDGATYRLRVRGKWIHDRKYLWDKTLKDTGWWTVAHCVGNAG